MAGAASPLFCLIVNAAVLPVIMPACRYAGRRVRHAGGLALVMMPLWSGVVVGSNVGVIVRMGKGEFKRGLSPVQYNR